MFHPHLNAGHSNADTYPTNFTYPGKDYTQTPGVVLSVPAGQYNSLHLSYFRTQGRGSETLTQNSTLFTADFAPGDFLNTSYTLQMVKVSWDYLTWHWPPEEHRLLIKTLWEVQYATIKSSLNAPYKATTDSQGNAVTTSGMGSHQAVEPTFGLGVEYFLSKHLRFEGKASGFGIPHRALIWDAEGFLAYRMGLLELDLGAKAFDFKTSPKGVDYFKAMPYGAYVGLVFYPSFK